MSFVLPLKERVKATPMQNLVARDEQLACAFVCASSSPVAENVYQLLTTEFLFFFVSRACSSRCPVGQQFMQYIFKISKFKYFSNLKEYNKLNKYFQFC